MSEWLSKIFDECGENCPNCGTWRRLCDDYFIEKCQNCGDEEIYIFDVDEHEIP